MKILLAFVYFFGSILIIFGLLWLMVWVAPPEYMLDRAALSNHNGRFDHPERILPNLPFKEPFAFPGSTAGLAAKDDEVKGWVLLCKNKKEAEALFKAYGSQVAKGDKWQSSGPGYLNYSLSDPGLRGQVKLIDEVIVHVQGRDDDRIERAFQQAGLIIANPRANILTEIAHTNKYLWHIVIFILVYTAIQFPIWNRVASWAAAIRPKAGIQAVSEPELRQRLLAINTMDVPFRVIEKKGKKLDVVWRLADAKWVGLMTTNKVSRISVKLGGGVRKSHLAIIVKVVDSRTGRRLASEQVEGTATDIEGMSGLSGGVLSGAFSGYSKTPMEKAVRICIDEAVKLIVAKTPKEYYRVPASSDAQTDSQAAPPPPPAVPQRSGASSKSPSSGQPQAVTRSGPSQPSAPASGPEARVVYVKWKTVSLREGPGTNFKSLAEIKKGTALEILEDKGQWIRVRLEDGQEGWIGKATTCETP